MVFISALDKRVSAVSTPDSYHSRSATPTWNALEQVVVNAGSKIDPAVIRISPNSDDVICSIVSSPVRKVDSKRRSKSRSPRRRSRSPKRRSRSPRRKSRSPKRKSRSPKRKSRSPKRKSRSPKRKSRSPKRKSRSPKRKSRSPGRKRISHRKRSKTPPSSYNISSDGKLLTSLFSCLTTVIQKLLEIIGIVVYVLRARSRLLSTRT